MSVFLLIREDLSEDKDYYIGSKITVFQTEEMMGVNSLIQPSFNKENDQLKHHRENMRLD